MKIPSTAAEAAAFIERKAKKDGVCISVYCNKRKVSPSVITRWKKKYKNYQVNTFLRLIAKPSSK